MATSPDFLFTCGNFGKPDMVNIGTSSRFGNSFGNLKFLFLDASCPMDLVSLTNTWFPVFQGLHLATGHSGNGSADAYDSTARGDQLSAYTAGFIPGFNFIQLSVGDAWMRAGIIDIQSGCSAVVVAAGATREEQFSFSREILQRLEISHEEISKEEILREFGQAAQVDPQTQQLINVEPAREIRNFLNVTRQLKGIPVWSSHLQMGLTADRKIGFLELHWPIISESIIREAQRLTFKVCNGWEPPTIPAAMVESVEAGIIHTPAVGYFFDIHAAVRVIYKSLDQNIGRKPMYHLDRHAEPILLRRTSELIDERSLVDARPRKEDTADCL
jgi:Family of unknown function (DUF6345)